MPERIIDQTAYPIQFEECDPFSPHGKFGNPIPELMGFIPVSRKRMVYVEANRFFNFFKSKLQ
jgi:hypothetical protein